MTDKNTTSRNSTQPDHHNDNLLNQAQVAQMLGISEATLTTWWCRQRYPLPFVKIGSRVMYRRKSVEDFILSREQGNSSVE